MTFEIRNFCMIEMFNITKIHTDDLHTFLATRKKKLTIEINSCHYSNLDTIDKCDHPRNLLLAMINFCMKSKIRDTQFMPEVPRINFGLQLYQSVEVLLKYQKHLLQSCKEYAYASLWILGNMRFHALVIVLIQSTCF